MELVEHERTIRVVDGRVTGLHSMAISPEFL